MCLSLKHPQLFPVLALFVVKELFQLIAGAVHLKMGKMLPGALMAGKVCTTVLFISLIALVLFPLVDDTAVSVIAAVDAVFLGISFVSYILAYFGKNAKVQDLKANRKKFSTGNARVKMLIAHGYMAFLEQNISSRHAAVSPSGPITAS